MMTTSSTTVTVAAGAAVLLSLSAIVLATPEDPAKLARRFGYDSEAHTAKTEDGYLLSLFHVRNVSARTALAEDKDPVLIVPGLACNAAIWVLLGPGKALAYLLADHGYDVWLADYRGGMFSRRHVNLSEWDTGFWNYSYDDIGRLDVPALLRLVVSVSGRPSVSYIGHSMGASALSIMASSRPEDVQLVARAYLLAPAVYMGHASQPAVYGSAGAVTRLHSGLGLFPSGEIPLNSWWMHATIQGLCSNAVSSPMCLLLGGVYAGHDGEQINKTAISFYVDYIPDSMSVKNVQHFTQHFGKERNFRRFDYGLVGNMAAYGLDQPPGYNLNRSTFPASIYYGSNDFLVSPQDVIDFSDTLTNLVRPPRKIPMEKFSHIDFFLAMDAKTLLYDDIIKDLAADEMKLH